MLKAIWPSVAHIPNRLPASSNITTVGPSPSFIRCICYAILIHLPFSGMMCYFLYWLIQFPLMFISPQNIRHFFTVKGIVVPIAWLSILIWAFVKVPPKTSLDPLHTSLHGSGLSWAWLSALNSALGIYATLAVNIPDFTVRGQFVHFLRLHKG